MLNGDHLVRSNTGGLRNFKFDAERNGRRYATKQVRPVFVEEAGEIVVVTVYVYYF